MSTNEFTLTVGKTKQVANVIKTTVDNDTGEVLQQEVEKSFTTVVKTDNFFMCFFENFGAFYGLKTLADVKLMTCMCELAGYNTGIIQMNTKVRQLISQRTGLSVSNMSKNLKRLVAADLISVDCGQYTINPAVFWKGSLQERIDIIKSGGLTFKVRFIGDNEKGK